MNTFCGSVGQPADHLFFSPVVILGSHKAEPQNVHQLSLVLVDSLDPQILGPRDALGRVFSKSSPLQASTRLLDRPPCHVSSFLLAFECALSFCGRYPNPSSTGVHNRCKQRVTWRPQTWRQRVVGTATTSATGNWLNDSFTWECRLLQCTRFGIREACHSGEILLL